MSEIQKKRGGTLVELIFSIKEKGGWVEIGEMLDDIKDFVIRKSNIRVDQIEIN